MTVNCKIALVCGAGDSIIGHLLKRLKEEGYWVRGVDIKMHEYVEPAKDEFIKGDLRSIGIILLVHFSLGINKYKSIII